MHLWDINTFAGVPTTVLFTGNTNEDTAGGGTSGIRSGVENIADFEDLPNATILAGTPIVNRVIAANFRYRYTEAGNTLLVKNTQC